jgi:hypothetical protein
MNQHKGPAFIVRALAAAREKTASIRRFRFHGSGSPCGAPRLVFISWLLNLIPTSEISGISEISVNQ